MADYRYSFQDVKRVFQPQWMAPEGNQILSDQLYTLLKFRLNEFTYRVWWINCNMLHSLHDIVIHDGLKGLCDYSHCKACEYNFLSLVKF